MTYYDYDKLNERADITMLHGIPADLKRSHSTNGTELHGACPFTKEGNTYSAINQS